MGVLQFMFLALLLYMVVLSESLCRAGTHVLDACPGLAPMSLLRAHTPLTQSCGQLDPDLQLFARTLKLIALYNTEC